jgi:hypothetical protein
MPPKRKEEKKEEEVVDLTTLPPWTSFSYMLKFHPYIE